MFKNLKILISIIVMSCLITSSTMIFPVYAATGTLNTWAAPAGVTLNNTYSVSVRRLGDTTWIPLSVYNTKVGRQEGDPVTAGLGLSSTPVNSSMVMFDFNETVQMKVTLNSGYINSWKVWPTSYGITATKDSGNTFTFNMTQNQWQPKKVMFSINDNFESLGLSILTNWPEDSTKPSPTDSNVYLVNPGSGVPFYLPAGKDTIYFAPGIHTLGSGLWFELDLLQTYSLDHFELNTGTLKEIFYKCGAEKFTISGKATESASYTMLYNGTGNWNYGTITGALSGFNARYIMINLLGNNNSNRSLAAGTNYFNSSAIKEFKLFPVNSSTNVAQWKFLRSPDTNAWSAIDGNDSTWFTTSRGSGNTRAGESYFIHNNSTKIYLAPGSYVKGAITAEDKSNIVVSGRGILSGENLVSGPASLQEGKCGVLWLLGGSDNWVDGITILNSPMWAINMNYGLRPGIINANVINSVVNGDGVHMSGVNDGYIRGIFTRSPDDQVCIYHYAPANNITIENSVFFSDGGRALLIGLGTTPNSTISNVTFNNNDILGFQAVWDVNKYQGGVYMWATANNTITDIDITNTRFEQFRYPSVNAMFKLTTAYDSEFGSGGIIKNILFENISYPAKGGLDTLIYGAATNDYINNITFRNFYIGGTKLTSSNYTSYINFSGYVTDYYIQ